MNLAETFITNAVMLVLGAQSHQQIVVQLCESAMCAIQFTALRHRCSGQGLHCTSVDSTKKSVHSASKCARSCFGCIDVSHPDTMKITEVPNEMTAIGGRHSPARLQLGVEKTVRGSGVSANDVHGWVFPDSDASTGNPDGRCGTPTEAPVQNQSFAHCDYL